MSAETISESGVQRKCVVGADDDGRRLDRFLAGACADLSRSRIKALIQAGNARVDDAAANEPAAKLRAGQVVSLFVPAATEATPQAQAMDLAIVFEDDDVIVVDKPAGLVVHPGAGNRDKTLVNALIAHCGDSLSGIGGVKRPGIVHRLDKETSGLLVAAKNDAAHAGLAEQFAAHSVARVYKAAVWGTPRPVDGRIAGNIGRSNRNRKKMAVVGDAKGKTAVTHYVTIERFGAIAALVECRLETGRTHQIRVHLSHAGHALIGDPVYGSRRRAPIARQALHAAHLGFQHPITRSNHAFDSPIPPDFRQLLGWLKVQQHAISES